MYVFWVQIPNKKHYLLLDFYPSLLIQIVMKQNRKIEGLQMAFQKMEQEINELKEKLNILQNPLDTNQSER